MKLTLAAILLLISASVQAQSYQCRAPSVFQPSQPVQKPRSEPRRIKPVTSYTLALSWSPEFCRTRKNDKRHKTQCSGDDGSFGFILHGLWPDAPGAYPQWCRPTKPLSPALLKKNFCMIPSARLMASEWAKHGSCMTRRPETYFRISKIMFDAVEFPNMDRLSRKPLTAGELRNAFASENAGLAPDMIRLKINSRGWFEEARICLGPSFKPRRCPVNMPPLRTDLPVKIWRGA